jgi:hypothetical protein
MDKHHRHLKSAPVDAAKLRLDTWLGQGYIDVRANRGEDAMAWSDEDRVRELAQLAGITIEEEEVAEVASRFGSLMQELERLKELDLSDIQPVVIFPEEP